MNTAWLPSWSGSPAPAVPRQFYAVHTAVDLPVTNTPVHPGPARPMPVPAQAWSQAAGMPFRAYGPGEPPPSAPAQPARTGRGAAVMIATLVVLLAAGIATVVILLTSGGTQQTPAAPQGQAVPAATTTDDPAATTASEPAVTTTPEPTDPSSTSTAPSTTSDPVTTSDSTSTSSTSSAAPTTPGLAEARAVAQDFADALNVGDNLRAGAHWCASAEEFAANVEGLTVLGSVSLVDVQVDGGSGEMALYYTEAATGQSGTEYLEMGIEDGVWKICA